jgi:hypothetical protein
MGQLCTHLLLKLPTVLPCRLSPMAVRAQVPAAVLLVMILVAQSLCRTGAALTPAANAVALRRLRGATAVMQSKCSPRCFQQCKVQCPSEMRPQPRRIEASQQASQAGSYPYCCTYAATGPPPCDPEGCKCSMCASGM